MLSDLPKDTFLGVHPGATKTDPTVHDFNPEPSPSAAPAVKG